jgi:MOSC domain-containing protein YiiM
MRPVSSVEAIILRPVRAGKTVAVTEVRAVAGQGLEGDHGFPADMPEREITLIEAEAIEALAREEQLSLGIGEPRRNIVTRGVPLNHLVDREFHVGETTLRGIKLCEPCGHLEKLTQPGVREGLMHRGGLRACIIQGGTIRVGDPVTL